ncbi:craniofacial development protein 2-like [Penaeus chinensis]|uniref:craniofacial development protein 2-like n=1 Tax=Penaeus chinensis TaxID=139456 RepID=UPI001FB7E491|nr:craniofacial development protein 2-like [Penaeus chinensis]
MGGEIVNIVSAYAPQTDCNAEEKDEFYEKLDDELREIPTSEKLWIGGDFNGHCGNDNIGKEEYTGKHGVGECNEAGEQFMDFAIDYILCQTIEKANIRDCKVILGECVMSQHRPVICTLSGKKLELKKLAGKSKTDKETWWWNEEVQQHIKLKKETKKILDQENNIENREAYKIAK